MKIWVDAHISPAFASWLSREFGIEAIAVRDVGMREAKDPEILDAARVAGASLLTKDSDFVEMVERRGSPPQIIWITCGNTSNQALQRILQATFVDALDLLRRGEPIVEISDG